MSASGSIKRLFQRIFSKAGTKPDNEKDVELDYFRNRVDFLEKLLEEKTLSVEKAKSNFLKNLYHEIRTPLNAIIGFSDLIELNHVKGKEKEEYVQHIRESSREFLRKMDNIIEASIIEAGLLKIQNEQCMLKDLLYEIHTYFSLHKHIEEKKIAFLVSVPKMLQKTEVECDVFRITQVLTHLISNAFKYTHHGVVDFGCKVVNRDLQFFVKDTGIGGLEGREASVFKNFSKMEYNYEEENEGLGLGLGLSKSIIEQMNGRIWYESRKDRGTTFYFTIPFKPVYVTRRKEEKESHQKFIIPLGRVYRRSVIL